MNYEILWLCSYSPRCQIVCNGHTFQGKGNCFKQWSTSDWRVLTADSSARLRNVQGRVWANKEKCYQLVCLKWALEKQAMAFPPYICSPVIFSSQVNVGMKTRIIFQYGKMLILCLTLICWFNLLSGPRHIYK